MQANIRMKWLELFVDSSHEDQLREMPEEVLLFHEKIRNQLSASNCLLAPFSIVQLFFQRILVTKVKKSDFPKYPDLISDMRIAHMCTQKYMRAMYEEISHMAESFEQIQTNIALIRILTHSYYGGQF